MKDNQHSPVKHRTFFRFYEELNDFLPQSQRKNNFVYEYIGKPAIKDTIEAIGVPHSAIDLILVNGKSVRFDYKMQGAEQVSVYPVFELFDITPLVHLRAKPLRNTKFVVDVNLGKLARKLRLLGFDTLYRNDLRDDEIVKYSVTDKRIILTRDKAILKYRSVTHGYWVRNTEPYSQIKEVIDHLQLVNQLKPFTRCSCCNGVLQPIEKSAARAHVQVKTHQLFDVFMQCSDCKKVYWRGSHFDRSNQWIAKLHQ
jgi:uncharacterized protein with PIN domain